MDLFSASQVTLFGECKRKWAWRYIAGIKSPPNASALLGIECDDTQLQPYLRDDRPLDFSRDSGYIVAPGQAYLPKPKSSGLEVQKHFTMPSPSWVDGNHIGFGYQGFIDLWLPNGGMPDISTTGTPTVCDFKTTGNWKYAKTSEGLATDVQAQLYATWAMFATKARTVDLVWIYFATKGPRKAKRVHLRVVADQVAEQFSRINDIAVEMYAVRKSVTDPLDLPPSVDMCDGYGGCPYRANCNLSPSEFLDAKASQHKGMDMSTTSGLLARLKAQQTGAPPVGINPPESLLAPAPPVGVVETVAAAPEEKAKRGRPRATKDPVVDSDQVNEVLVGETVSVTWAEETLCPIPYNPFKVGPFEATGFVRKGETVAQATSRIYYELAAFAEQARTAKAVSFRAALTAVGGAK